MGFWLTRFNQYHEGDELPFDIVVTKRPGPTFLWNGTAWAEDPLLKQAVLNEQLLKDLAITDDASMRSVRELTTQVARISQYTQPPLTSDQTFLLQYYNQAAQLRSQINPPTPPTLDTAKLDRIAQLTQQGAAYIQLGFIFQTIQWATKKVFDILYMTLAGTLVSGNLLTPDSKLHLWDVNNVERVLTPLNAGKLAGALYNWLYLTQKEYFAAIAQVNALTTVPAVQAFVWTTVYNPTKLYNADLPIIAQDPTFVI
jgi:hypothetical protein